MAIYGLNFNGTQIPEGVARKFAKRIKGPLSVNGRPQWLSLKGVAQSSAERDAMISVADNGRRIVQIIERVTVAGPWFGVYCDY